LFVAKFKDGTIISMGEDWRVEELKELRKKRKFYCPTCQQEVQLKLGRTRLWHFAHHSNECQGSLEHESMYHLKGKMQLYNWLKKQNVKVALECYLPIIRQRPDLLFRYNEKLYALEYQCSPLETTLMEKRTRGYEQIGIIPLWIFGGNRLKRHGPNTFSLKAFEWLASRTSKKHHFHLTYFCPDQNRFAHLHQLTPYSPIKVLTSYHETPTFHTTIDSIIYPQSKENINILEKWLTIKKNWRYQTLSPYPSKLQRNSRNLLYKNRIPPGFFPIEAGWPTAYHYLFASSPKHWQLLLLFECLQHQPLQRSFPRRIVSQCMYFYIEHNWINLRRMPSSTHWELAVKGYLHFLVKIGYLEKINEKEEDYKRVKDITIPSSLEEAIKLDHMLKVQVMNQNNQGYNKGISVRKTNI